MTVPILMIIGCGPGSAEYVTPAARAAVAVSQVIAGAGRLLGLFPEFSGRRVVFETDLSALMAALGEAKAAGQTAAVLVSGDPGLYSLAAAVVRQFGREACRIIPAVSSVQVAFARLGLDWAGARIVSAHGRTPQASSRDLATSDKIAVLAGTAEALRWCSTLATDLGETHVCFLCENLTLADERVRPLTAAELAACQGSSLAIVILVRRECVQ